MGDQEPLKSSCTDLCSSCQSLFNPELVHGENNERVELAWYKKKDSLPVLNGLASSAKGGCLLCAEVRARILEQKWPNSITDIVVGPATLVFESYYREAAADEDGPFSLRIAITPTNSKSRDTRVLCFDLFAMPGSYGKIHLRMHRSPPWTNRTSPECIAMMHSWLSQCSTVHWPCASRGKETIFLPTRLIDVGPADGSVLPRLIANVEAGNKYIALSHCWGKPGPGIRSLKTVASTIEHHQRGITLDR